MQSMTGFGRAEHATDHLIARVEISSVNRKQADIVFNLPRELSEIEPALRKIVLKEVSRGRVNVSINLEAASASTDSLSINPTRAQALEAAFTELSDLLNRPIQADSHDFLRAPGVFLFQDSGINPNQAAEAIQPALEAALANLVTMRTREGVDLNADFLERLDLLEGATAVISEKAPLVVVRQRENLHNRLREAEIEINLNDERLLKELALFSERCDISEETTRLASHFAKFRETMELKEPVGRSLDFLCQEINRELNTIGSKANDAGIAQHVVIGKTELEKIREQVQNVE
ncbi:MAG: YicC family protein [Akkermansiaceae bacterium]|nr:YicC family protein [Akkermansiaceae bacterium]